MNTRNPGLDLLRAIAIAMVLICHFTRWFAPNSSWVAITSIGGHGVDLFFVLSGWLLGSQLFREIESTGTIRLARFWIRRGLRTLPAYYALLFATFAQMIVQKRIHEIDWRYLVFLQNYLPEMPYLGVTWSLCVEEHFYLVVAPAIWLAFHWRYGTAVVLLVVTGLLLAHVLGAYPTVHTYEIYASHIRWEQCACGVMLAWIASRRPALLARLQRVALPLFLISLVLYGLAIANRTLWDFWLPGWGVLGWGLIFASWVLLALTYSWLPAPAPVRFVALRAYSLYLVHVEAIRIAMRFTSLPSELQCLLAVVLLFLFAEVLYRLVEQPFSNLRERLAISRHTSTR